MRGNNGTKFFVVILVIAIITSIAVFGLQWMGVSSDKDVGLKNIRYGIDIRGGVYTTLYPDIGEGIVATDDQLDIAEQIINVRLDDKGIFDRNVAIDRENKRIVVEIPHAPGQGELNPQQAIDELGKMALLTFQEVDEELYDGFLPYGGLNYLPTGRIVIEGKHVESAGVERDPQTGAFVVSLRLNSEGAVLFEEATGRLINKKIAIFMDDILISAPNVQGRIPAGGNAIITGQRDAREAGELASTINAGALPFGLEAKEVNSITATLGEGALMIAIYAGIIAFILIFMFMLFFYRLPGLIANIAVFGLVVTQLLFLSMFRVNLTLPGIAGIILSVGMGVDANIIIFERIKEELKSGKTLKSSIDAGFKRAFSAILDANITTIITGLILYWLGTGPIKGFAFTLVLGVILSFITAVTASRIMLKSVSDVDVARNKWLYGA